MKTVGYQLNVLGRTMVVKQKPTNEVVKFISKEQFDKGVSSLESRFLVTEGLPLLNGGIAQVFYIKSSKTHNSRSISSFKQLNTAQGGLKL